MKKLEGLDASMPSASILSGNNIFVVNTYKSFDFKINGDMR
jgi:hypothetical protein